MTVIEMMGNDIVALRAEFEKMIKEKVSQYSSFALKKAVLDDLSMVEGNDWVKNAFIDEACNEVLRRARAK